MAAAPPPPPPPPPRPRPLINTPSVLVVLGGRVLPPLGLLFLEFSQLSGPLEPCLEGGTGTLARGGAEGVGGGALIVLVRVGPSLRACLRGEG
jgi:hypothetical protein